MVRSTFIVVLIVTLCVATVVFGQDPCAGLKEMKKSGCKDEMVPQIKECFSKKMEGKPGADQMKAAMDKMNTCADFKAAMEAMKKKGGK